jgi:large subunit ribosomal protein L3
MASLWKSLSLLRLSNSVGSESVSKISPLVRDNNVLLFTSYNLSTVLVPKRDMSRVKHRKTHPFFWWTKKRRERNDQEITGDNQAFINQAILDKYGPAYVKNSTGMPYVSPLKEIVRERNEWTPRSIRTGVIARKIGVYPMWNKDGLKFYTTLLQVVDNHVIRYISPEECQKNYGNRFGTLGMLIVGAESADPQLFTKEYCGLFQQSGTLPKVRINRFTITPDAALQPGTPLYATHFQVGQWVDVAGKTIDRGFQGVMKRWGFKGLRATHGVTKSHRRGGNIGGGGEKGRVWPGTKMPGHMGGLRRTLFGLKIVRINTKYNVIYVHGQNIAGETNNFVSIRDTFLPTKRFEAAPPFPTYYPDEAQEPLPDDMFDADVHTFSEPSIYYEDKV